MSCVVCEYALYKNGESKEKVVFAVGKEEAGREYNKRKRRVQRGNVYTRSREEEMYTGCPCFSANQGYACYW